MFYLIVEFGYNSFGYNSFLLELGIGWVIGLGMFFLVLKVICIVYFFVFFTVGF